MVQDISLSAQYDFGYYCNVCRILQIVASSIQVLLIWSEASNLSYLRLFFYVLLVGGFFLHVFKRWYSKIDGRFDIRQFMAAKQPTQKAQYAAAVFTAIPLAMFIWHYVELQNSFVYLVFYLSGLTAVGASVILLTMEVYEVFGKQK